MQDHPIVLAKPELATRKDLDKVIPIGVRRDGVSYVQARAAGAKTLEFLRWASMLAQGPTMTSNILMLLIFKSVVKESGFDLTWVKNLEDTAMESDRSTGRWPEKDFDGSDFADQDSMDYVQKGKPLADGFAAVAFVFRSDPLPVSSRSIPGLTSMDRLQVGSNMAPDYLDRAEVTPTPHQFFRILGTGLDLVCPDLMHCRHLGTDQVLLGTVLSTTWVVV